MIVRVSVGIVDSVGYPSMPLTQDNQGMTYFSMYSSSLLLATRSAIFQNEQYVQVKERLWLSGSGTGNKDAI